MPTVRDHGDLFDQQERDVSDSEAMLWAERLIRDVSQAVNQERIEARKFNQAWLRWMDLVRFLNQVELGMHKYDGAPPASKRDWHKTLASALISLGEILKGWATSFDSEVLDIVGFDAASHGAALQSVHESYELWHCERNHGLEKELSDLLP